MSRIGLAPISIPEKVEVNISGSTVSVKGPKGEMSRTFDSDFKFEMEGNEISVVRPTEQKRHKALHGLYRSLVANMIEGVEQGFKVEQEFVGVGYKVAVKGQVIEMAIGYSHDVHFKLPEEIKANAEMVKGQPPLLTMESCDKQLLGQVAAKIRSLRKPEPYKGKGIKFKGERIRRKAGKAAAK